MAGKVGFIGLGNMGFGMAANVLKRYPVIAYDINPEPVRALAAQGAEAASSLAYVAAEADTVITMLPGGTQVEQVYLDAGGLAEAARPDQIFIDMSTCHPGTTRKVGAALAERGAHLLDAPVARTKQAAIDGTLSIMVGGPPELFEACRDLLRTMGTDVWYCGELGAGEVVKLVNNMILFSTVAVLAECLPLAQAWGVDPGRLVRILQSGSADSFAMRHHVGQSVLHGDLGPGRFSVAYALKDTGYALELGDAVGLPMPLAMLTKAKLQEAMGRGWSDWYYPVIFKLAETITGRPFRVAEAEGGR
ncbi:MAG: NAD(P)-dependent oxidoreductase [Actinomycetia bacterium]|nr:NAD(P)-dependent oxidoreductase [Actinomycetes bacterium]